MKIYLLSFFILMCLTGCNSADSTTELVSQMQDYINFNGDKCIEYVDNDTKLSNRQKEIYKARHRSIKQILNAYVENNNVESKK